MISQHLQAIVKKSWSSLKFNVITHQVKGKAGWGFEYIWILILKPPWTQTIELQSMQSQLNLHRKGGFSAFASPCVNHEALFNMIKP